METLIVKTEPIRLVTKHESPIALAHPIDSRDDLNSSASKLSCVLKQT
ncbi:hypothetical protein [Methanobrevibacter sp. V74]|nr:hypothetical protein [Methanobrevibacter sp. V74]